MNTMLAKVNDTVVAGYCVARAGVTHLSHKLHDREQGQTSIEYVGLLLIVGTALIVGLAVTVKAQATGGVMSNTITKALENGLKAAFKKIGVDVG